MIQVNLTEQEVTECRGNLAAQKSLGRDLQRHKYRLETPTDEEITGILGERAAAKGLHLNWNPQFIPGARFDVGNLQVRTTRHRRGGLVLHPSDRDADKFVLVLSLNTETYLLAGWLLASDGKKFEFWRGEWRCPAYCVPQERLLDIETLPT